MYLQSYVVPVCLYENVDGNADIKKLIGTAFFINDDGIFLTANHVMQSAFEHAENKNLTPALVVKGENGSSPDSLVSNILSFNAAPDPFDIAIGKVNYSCSTLLSIRQINITEWQDVATYGYPLHATSGNPASLTLNMRCHKGYIQRLLSRDTLNVGINPEAFELSFLLSKGLSGAPLFVPKDQNDIVIGVCVGSYRTELIEDEYLEVQDDGNEYKEMKLKIEEFGIAHDLRPLHDWKPELLNGNSLIEC